MLTGFDSNQFGRDQPRLITHNKSKSAMCHPTTSLQISWKLMVVPEPETAARVDVKIIITYCSIWAIKCSHMVDHPTTSIYPITTENQSNPRESFRRLRYWDSCKFAHYGHYQNRQFETAQAVLAPHKACCHTFATVGVCQCSES